MAEKIRLPRVFVQLLAKKYDGSLLIRWKDGETVLFFKQGLPLHTPDLLEPFGKKIMEVHTGSQEPPEDLNPVNPFTLLWKGICRYPTSLLLEEAGELVGPYMSLKPGSMGYVEKFPFSPPLNLIPDILDREPFNHLELKEILGEDDESILKVLYSLASCTLLAPADPPHDEQTRRLRVELLQRRYASETQDPFEILGVSRSANKSDIERAFRDLARRLHPDAIMAKGLSEWREEAEELFRKISESYTLLSNDEERQRLLNQGETQEVSGVLDSELLFQKGRILLKRKEYAAAAEHFKQALEQVPDEAVYLAYHAWAMYKAAQDKSDVRTEVLGMLHKATEKAPRLAIAHYFLGKVLVDAGLVKEAIERMERAARLDRNLIEAAREARILKRRKDKQHSLTGKFFSFLRKE